MTSRRLFILLGPAMLLLGTLVGGCPPETTNGGADLTTPNKLERFQSADELLQYFRSQANARRVQSRFGFFFGAPAAMEDGQATGGGDADQAPNAAPGDYSSTNVQELGVDESDVVKSDGTNVYIAKGSTLRIVRASPATELAELAQLEFDARIDSLYLRDGYLLVLTQDWGAGATETDMMWPPYYARAQVQVAAVDITDPANPAITAQNTLDGSLVSSRLTNDRLILVLTITPELPANPTTLQISRLELDDIMPAMVTSAGEAYLVPVEHWYRPSAPDGYCTTAVLTLDAADVESVLGSTAIMANAGTIYASTEALYLTDAVYDENDDYREVIAIHKLAFNAEGIAEYVASGKVPGRLLNQFSLGEHDGNLRVATHVNNFGLWLGFGMEPGMGIARRGGRMQDVEPDDDQPPPAPEAPYNAVYVLREADDDLEVVGALENIAPGEQLYAARFLGARGYLVTFLQIDPLFVLDLSDPTAPAIVGELEIPGYSDYLHPFGEDRLIGVGRSTADWGATPDALQLSLFDTTDPNNPTLVEQLELGGWGSYSDVSFTHKAFTFMPETGLLVLPAELWTVQNGGSDAPWDWYSVPEFDGVICLQVTDDGFTELGRVAGVHHEDWPWNDWRRAAVIGETVYAITPAGVRAAGLADFDATEEIELTPSQEELDYWNGMGGGWGGMHGGWSEPGRPGPR